MRILAIDTSLDACSVAIFVDGAARAVRSELIGVGHAERLAPMAADALAEARIAAAEIDVVGVVVGPGTFAGVRVGVAFARGFAAGGTMRVAGVVGLRAIAQEAASAAGSVIAPVIDARRGGVYIAAYDGDRALLEPSLAPVSEAAQRIATIAAGRAIAWRGPGAPLVAREFAPFAAIDLAAVAALASAADAPPATPLYLRPPDAAPARPQRFQLLVGP